MSTEQGRTVLMHLNCIQEVVLDLNTNWKVTSKLRFSMILIKIGLLKKDRLLWG